jgi:hypothetical protein
MTKSLKVTVLIGPPGCGKTTQLLLQMTQMPGRYLFAMPRNALIQERVRDLHKRASIAGTAPSIVPIHSDQGSRIPVLRRVKDAATEFATEPHVIVLITHEALVSVDLNDFGGWHVRIDEQPEGIVSNSFRTPASWRWLQAAYDLEQVHHTKWSKVRVRTDCHSIRDLLKDDLAGDLATFHKKALSPQGVLVDLYDWSAAQSRREVRWCSVWTVLELAHFESIKIAASSFFTSISYLATEAWFPGKTSFEREVIDPGRCAYPSVRIHYFAREHCASTSWWSTAQGRDCLRKVGQYLAGVDLGYWSGNEIVRDRFEMVLSGQMVSPKLAGTNDLRHHTSCAMIYSNKSQRADDAVLEVFGLTRDDIERARQTEDLQQFVMRGAIRCPDFGGVYDIYVYDGWQADALAEFIKSQGITDVELIPVEEAGITDVQRPTPGPKPRTPDPVRLAKRKEDQRRVDAERKRRVREKEREAKRAAGTLRARGRPPVQRA